MADEEAFEEKDMLIRYLLQSFTRLSRKKKT